MTKEKIESHFSDRQPPDQADPELDALVGGIIARVADQWTILILETLEEYGRLNFTRLGELVDMSQMMLTKTLGQMYDGSPSDTHRLHSHSTQSGL
ncbi:hypothetical protein [Deinococcus alpinitundrae]|uniref:hypothetical protein n=1 Tax=Deinococcus alpinitundrae TaxID=468913 RepID=UPI001ED909DA|nr:hypothetical protein [Deinococcus alpinitundrae]